MLTFAKTNEKRIKVACAQYGKKMKNIYFIRHKDVKLSKEKEEILKRAEKSGMSRLEIDQMNNKLKTGEIHSEKIYSLPFNNWNKVSRKVMFYSGKSGSGKSTKCGEHVLYLQKWYKKHIQEDKKIVIFSLKKEGSDPAFKNFPDNSIYIDVKEFCEYDIQDIDIELFANKLIIFDDICLLDKKDKKKIEYAKNICLEIGRAYNVDVFIIQHLATNGYATKTVLNECTDFIIFPDTCTKQQLLYLLNKKYGIDQKIVNKIKNERYCQVIPLNKIMILDSKAFIY